MTVGNLLDGISTPYFSVERLVGEGLVAEVATSSDTRIAAAKFLHREGASRYRGDVGDLANEAYMLCIVYHHPLVAPATNSG